MKPFILAVLFILLAGCINQSPKEYYLISPEDAWIQDCIKAQPPSRERYLNADDFGKLYLITSAYNAQTKAIDECNVRMKALRKWKAEEEEKARNK